MNINEITRQIVEEQANETRTGINVAWMAGRITKAERDAQLAALPTFEN